MDFFNELERAIPRELSETEDDDPWLSSNPDRARSASGWISLKRLSPGHEQYDILVVHDLAYADIVYDGWSALHYAGAARDVAVEFFTLSKKL